MEELANNLEEDEVVAIHTQRPTLPLEDEWEMILLVAMEV